jgi:hypothetical protein
MTTSEKKRQLKEKISFYKKHITLLEKELEKLESKNRTSSKKRRYKKEGKWD